MDAGGDVVVTQLFYDVELFLKFVKDCRSIGIEVPIIPGEHPLPALLLPQRNGGCSKSQSETYAGFVYRR